jgi:predicted RNase H-like nuclease (RuvC/YqgF family)
MIVEKLFKAAEVANMTPEEYELYVASLKEKNMYTYTPQDFLNDWKIALKESKKEIKTLTSQVSTLASQNTTLSGKVSTQAAEIAKLKQILKQAGLA